MGQLRRWCFIAAVALSLALLSSGLLRAKKYTQQTGRCMGADATPCWVPRPFRQVVIVIVDALRCDLAFGCDKSLCGFDDCPHPEGIPFLRNAPNSLRYVIEADPPTTTSQRLKALLTGSLPTFIDLGGTFSSARVLEDTWLAQVNKSGLSSFFVGDDTWMALAPIFSKSYPAPSFDVRDFDSVDDAVSAHVAEGLGGGYDVVVAHLLGVDHIG
jgi:GPI ethanolamine phosphate transferase 3 subunit O